MTLSSFLSYYIFQPLDQAEDLSANNVDLHKNVNWLGYFSMYSYYGSGLGLDSNLFGKIL